MMTTRQDVRELRTWSHGVVLDDDFASDDRPQPALMNDIAVALVLAAMPGTLVMWLM